MPGTQPLRAHCTRRTGLGFSCGMQAMAIAILLVLSGCTQSVTPAHATTPASTKGRGTPVATLPHFSDWRAVYLAPDGRAHIVTLSGQNDLAGPVLPDLTSSGLNINSAGVGPDGTLLAYGADDLNLVDLSGRTAPHSLPAYGGGDLVWSPDGSKLYSYFGGGQFSYVSLPSGLATNVAPGHGIADEVGWIDDTHLAVVSYQGANFVTVGYGDTLPTSATLDSLDITTHQVRTIATIQTSGPTDFRFFVSPNGTQVLYFDAPFRSVPFIPQAALVNLDTGTVTPLPAIAEATGSDFSTVTWRPDTDTLAVASSNGEPGPLKTWLIDVGADTATPIAPVGYPVGWTPNNGPLVLSSGYQSQIGLGPFTLTAVTCANNVHCSSVTLTEQAMTFAFLGFMRNP